MSEASKSKLRKVTGISLELADVLEASGFITPKDIKLADDADLESAGLTPEEITQVRVKCPSLKLVE